MVKACWFAGDTGLIMIIMISIFSITVIMFNMHAMKIWLQLVAWGKHTKLSNIKWKTLYACKLHAKEVSLITDTHLYGIIYSM